MVERIQGCILAVVVALITTILLVRHVYNDEDVDEKFGAAIMSLIIIVSIPIFFVAGFINPERPRRSFEAFKKEFGK